MVVGLGVSQILQRGQELTEQTNKCKFPTCLRTNKAEIKEDQIWTEARGQGELTHKNRVIAKNKRLLGNDPEPQPGRGISALSWLRKDRPPLPYYVCVHVAMQNTLLVP